MVKKIALSGSGVDSCDLTEVFDNMDEVEESLRAEGWESSREVAAQQAAREYAEFLNSLLHIRC